MCLYRTVLLLILAAPAAVVFADDAQDAYSQGDYARAIDLLRQQSAERPDDASLLIQIGRSHLGLNEPDESLPYFERAAQKAPADAEAHYWLGTANGTLASNASVFRAGSYAKKALAGFEAALRLDPRHVEAHKGLITYYRNAPRLFGGDKDKALELARSLIEIDEFEGKLVLADIYADDEKTSEAQAVLQQLAQAFPDDPRSYMALGFQAQGREDYGAAHSAFATASQASVHDENTRFARQMSLYQVGRTAVFSQQRLREGASALREYLDLPPLAGLPDRAWAMYRLARLYDMQDDRNNARDYYALAKANTRDKELLRQIGRFGPD